jgi:ParB family chromosome partitioning protein
MSKVVLGKGLEALIPGEGSTSGSDKRYRLIALERIAPNPLQPRREFDEDSLRELAASVKRNGLMQPLLVRQDGSTFTILAGERRFRAARLAELTEVPAVVMGEVDDARMLELALVENLQREDLNPIEAAEAYRTLMERCEYTQAQLAERVGKSRTAVANQLRLLGLPESIKQMLRAGDLSEGHGRAILGLAGEGEMLRLAEQIRQNALTVRDVEQRTSRVKRKRLLPKRKIPALAEAESRLKQIYGTSVKIHRGLKRGRIEIEFYSDDDLDRLLELLGSVSGRMV